MAAKAPALLTPLRRKQQFEVAQPRIFIPQGANGASLAQRQAQSAKILHARVAAARLPAQAHQRVRPAAFHHHQRAARKQQAVHISGPGHRFHLQRRPAHAAHVSEAVSVHQAAHGLRRILLKGDERRPCPAILHDRLHRHLPPRYSGHRQYQQHQRDLHHRMLHMVFLPCSPLFRSAGPA